jgi:V8-like Glu-specific endopeptidase
MKGKKIICISFTLIYNYVIFMSGSNEITDSESLEQRVKELEPLFAPRFDAMPELESMMAEPDGRDVYSMILESQCGSTDDSQQVEQYNGSLGVTVEFVRKNQAPVGQLQWNNDLALKYTNPGDVSGVRWGSGTLISDDLFLTAGHNFDKTGGGWNRPRDDETGEIITNEEIAANMHVNFNYQVDQIGNLRTEESFPVTQLVEYRLGGLDFAIVQLGNNPGQSFGASKISATDPSIGDMVCIMGHPAGQPKRVEAGDIDRLEGDYMGYNDIDTLGGNSGSGILCALEDSIVGVHTNGGCNPTGTGHNWGLRISKIIAQSPTIRSLLGYTLILNIIGRGSVSVNPDQPSYSGETVKLTARPDSGWNFAGWSGDLTGNENPIIINMDENKIINVRFTNCTIASLATGTVFAVNLHFLRIFRDEIILKSVFENQFKELEKRYYRYSPQLIKIIKEIPSLKNVIKYGFVYPFISLSNAVASTIQVIRKNQ